MRQDRSIDGYDRKILDELARDGRKSGQEVADAIGLSLTPTLRRVRRLEAEGYILKYVAVLDEAKLIGGMTAFISVTLERQVEDVLREFEIRVARMPEVLEGYLTSGSADYLLRAAVRSLDHYQTVIGELTKVPGVARIQSSFSLRMFLKKTN
ncbi:Lrp/AsnC family transcriptional regulator [Methylobacterium sp. BTF04]|uniref:Lrp/AsnC family transcriptional regulator n=1 Tax=Methylobacterium sp. BTF04 TaxID=2708300 RepID=UPI0013D3DC99|nr:Lrp/AsnC family transcriptional regulator [Methylobacterium sp. BTF04]NEU11116.1 Lrp/AsnC family transcriptional regulator [Methylobacterium sp. BTF04]